MVSRRKILSRSRDDLSLEHHQRDHGEHPQQRGVGFLLRDEDDVWYQKDKLYRDHIQEVLDKWESIDDEIWAKVIVLERNRRVAKAYARAPVLTVNGSDDGFDGFRIGVNGFENPLRDARALEAKRDVGQGCKIKMDEQGNILVKRFSRADVFVKNTLEENAVSNDAIKLANGALELEKPFKLFDMKKFQQNVNRELKRPFPDRRKIECQCISTVAFARSEPDLLDHPIWVMLINVVALEMLKAKMPDELISGVGAQQTREGRAAKGKGGKQAHASGPGSSATLNPPSGSRPGVRHSSEPRRNRMSALPPSGSSDEDPYSLTPSGSSGSSGQGNKGGKDRRDRSARGDSGSGGDSGGNNSSGHSSGGGGRLPSREKEYFGPQNWAKSPHRPDYSDDMDEENTTTTLKKKGGKSSSSGANGVSSSSGGSAMMMVGRSRQSREKGGRKSNKDSHGNSSSGDDPYYCGLRARVPNFTKHQQQSREGLRSSSSSKQLNGMGLRSPPPSRSVPNLQALASSAPVSAAGPSQPTAAAQLPGAAHPFWWHSRLYPQDAPHMVGADLTNYHYPGRMAPPGARGGGYRTALLGHHQGVQRHAHHYGPPPARGAGQAVFRTGWE